MIVESVELLANSLAHDGDLTVLTIVLDAIFKHKVQVVEEILKLQVLICVQLVFNCTKIHWLLNYVIVIGYVQLLRVHRFVEDPRLIVLPESI